VKANLLVAAAFIAGCQVALAQPGPTYRIPEYIAYFLLHAPDARSGGMGMAGTATSGDANATFWNAAKLTEAPKSFGASATYSPWLTQLQSGLWMGYATAYKKLGKGHVIAASVNYFDSPLLNSTGMVSDARDLSISASYAKQLGSHFSVGASLKYISSDYGDVVIGGVNLKPGRAVAADFGAYYNTHTGDPETGENINWTFGITLSNVGGKISYGTGPEHFLPTVLRLGGGFSYTADGKHKLNVTADAGKLLVPTPVPGRNVNEKPLLKAMVGSFSDAPGGFKEEMQEIVLAMGAEYWYKNAFALRGGYHTENRYKGDRKFFTAGAGARFFKNYGIDFAYLFPEAKGSPLKDTYKITGMVNF
jgi:hypothetical protein